MLISFSVHNFRSFSEKQTLSMVAGSGSNRNERYSIPTGNPLASHVLRSACLFGPNGSGKSTFVTAIGFFRDFVISSAKDTQEGEEIPVTPFKFDSNWRNQPSEFEIAFVYSDTLYQYGFALDKERVHSEWLFARPNSPATKTRMLFQREFDSETRQYAWRINPRLVKGERDLWKESTRDNALFLSTAIQLKAETFRDIFHWIQTRLRLLKSPDRLSPNFTAQKIAKDGWERKILAFLRGVDIGIESISVDEKEFYPSDLQFHSLFSKAARDDLAPISTDAETFVIKPIHKTAEGGSVELEFEEESDGTQVLIGLSAPLLDVLESGYTLIVDELNNSLHPLALKYLVNLFHSPNLNSGSAQLIFASHETSVMAKRFMHQDQVWLLEKGDKNNSTMTPLSDYKVRDISNFRKAYLDGRYGAVPRLGEFVDG